MTKKNPHLLGSKWTATHKTYGWRHFHVINRKDEGKWVFAEMSASCDANVSFWINAQQLKDSTIWQPGWLSLKELGIGH